MPSPSRRRSRALTLLGTLLAGLLAVLILPAGPAFAHASLISTDPVAGSTIPTAPKQITITFSEHIQAVTDKIVVVSPVDKPIDAGTATVSGSQLRIPVHTDVPEGTYLVSYRVISADGHPVSGGFTYSVGAPSPGGAPRAISGVSTNHLVAVLVSIVQFAGFAGLALVVGAVLVLTALWPRRLDRRAPSRLAYAGLGLVGVSALFSLYLEAPYGSGSSLFGVRGSDISVALDSTVGYALMIRVAMVLLAWFLIRPALAGTARRSDLVLLGLTAVVAIFTWPYAGHPAAASVPLVTVLADVIHLAAVAVWLGGLIMLAAFLLRWANACELGAILPVWSNWATLSIAVLVLGGTAQALIEIGSFDSLFHTRYGQLVIIKVALLVVILLVANTARRLVARNAAAPVPVAVPVAVGAGGGSEDLDGTDEESAGTDEDLDGLDEDLDDTDDDEVAAEPTGFVEPQLGRLRRSVFAELALAIVVLIATSILVQSSPARDAAAATSNDQGSVSLNSPLYTLQVDFLPQPGGGTELHMYAFTPTGGPQPVKQWQVTAALPASGTRPAINDDLGVVAVTQTHATSLLPTNIAGNWTFTFTLRTTDIDEDSVHTTVAIK